MNLFNCNSRDLEQCASRIRELVQRLAADGAERLEFHRNIGEELLKAKRLSGKDFVAWATETFGRGHEWRATHMRLALRWSDIDSARAWARSEAPKLASVISVDGILELLRAWDEARGHAAPRKKRGAAEEMKSGAAALEESGEQAELHRLRRLLAAQKSEAASFRKELSSEVSSRARSLVHRIGFDDGAAEVELRAIAREHCWFFADLCDELRRHYSGPPEFSPPLLRLAAPVASISATAP